MLKEFGVDRVMYGSDWPVLSMATGANYKTVANTLYNILCQHLQNNNQVKSIFCLNGKKFYNIC